MVRIKYRFNNNIETIILYNLDYHVVKYNEYFIAIDYTFDYFKHAKLNISISINDDTEVYKLCIYTPINGITADISAVDLLYIHKTPLKELMKYYCIASLDLKHDTCNFVSAEDDEKELGDDVLISHVHIDIINVISRFESYDDTPFNIGQSVISIKDMDGVYFDKALTLEHMNNSDIHKQYIMITDDNRYELLDIHADITGKILDINLIEEVKPNEVVLLYHNALGLEGGNEMVVDELAEYKSHYSDFRIQFRRYTSEEQLETCKDNKDNLLKTVLNKLLDLDE